MVLVFDDRCEKAIDNNCGEESLQHAALDSAKVMVFLIYPDQQILERSVVTDATNTTALENAGASECCEVDLSSVLDGDCFGVKLCRAGDEAQNNTESLEDSRSCGRFQSLCLAGCHCASRPKA